MLVLQLSFCVNTKNNAHLNKGEKVSSQSSNTVNSEIKVEEQSINHNAPNQAQMDSIKDLKTRNKK